MVSHGHILYTVGEYVQADVIDFISDLEIYVNSLSHMVPSPPDESELGDMVLSMVNVPLMDEEDSRDTHTEMEL